MTAGTAEFHAETSNNVSLGNEQMPEIVLPCRLTPSTSSQIQHNSSNPGGISLGSDGSTIWIVDIANGLLNRYDNAAARTNSNAAIPADAAFLLDAANSNRKVSRQ